MRIIEFEGDPMAELEKFENLHQFVFYLNKNGLDEIKSYSEEITKNIPSFFNENKIRFDFVLLAPSGIDEYGKEFPDTYIGIQKINNGKYKISGIYASDLQYKEPCNGEEMLLSRKK